MAWIKLTHAALDKPEIRKTARMLGVKHGEALELYLRWWVWLDVNSVDGLVDAFVDADVDELLHCPGISACMREVGWLSTDGATGKLCVTGFDDHNGESSKKRALKNKRQAEWRANVDAVVDRPVDAPPSTKASTREEKIRKEDKDIPATATAAPSRQPKESKPKPFPLPAGFAISDRVAEWARGKGHTRLNEHLEHFVGTAKAKGYKYVDWDEAFMNAIRSNWAKIEPPRPTAAPASRRVSL